MQHYVTVRRRRIRFLDAGRGHPVVFIHAFPLAADMWHPQLSDVPAGWRFIAPDLRGFGGSDRQADAGAGLADAGASSIDTYAHDVLALLDGLKIPSAIVVGLSMGGYVAFALHRIAATRLEALVLCDTRSEADTDDGRANRDRMLADLDRRGPAAVAEAMLPKLLRPETLADESGPADQVRRLIIGNASPGIADGIRSLKTRPDATPQLGTIACPTLLIVGRDDQLTPVTDHEAMHAAIVGSRLEIVEAAGHLSNLERPADFNRAVFDFLEPLLPAGHA